MVLVSATSNHGVEDLERLATAVALRLTEDAGQDARSRVPVVEAFPSDDGPLVRAIAFGKPFVGLYQRIPNRPFADALSWAAAVVNPIREVLIVVSGTGSGLALFRFDYPAETLEARVKAFQDFFE